MKTDKDIEKEFKKDLAELLKKYNATIESQDEYRGYPECGEDIQITVDIEGTYDTDGNVILPNASFKLGRYITEHSL